MIFDERRPRLTMLAGWQTLRARRIYFLTTPLLTRSPNFLSSLWIRLTYQVRLWIAISSIKAMTSGDASGLPCLARDRRLQYSRKPSRCHRSNVSGFTTTKASRQPWIRLASSTSTRRSCCVSLGRIICLSSTISCWRRNRFSAMSSPLLRLRSDTIPII
jgi:hypothetical protein